MRSAGVLWRRLPEGAVVLAPPGDPHVLNESAALVWDELTTGCTVEELIGRLSTRTGTDVATIAEGVEPLVHELVDLGIVRVAGPVRP